MARRRTSTEATGSDRGDLRFVIHPRAFTALGRDLVTNDVVAVLELVKNSYDALATRVDVRFVKDSTRNTWSLEIEDNGTGMTSSDIRDVWMVVATPHRLTRPVSKRGAVRRRASGEKGLGRLSAARLGAELTLLTKAVRQPYWQLSVNWDELAAVEQLSDYEITLNRVTGATALKSSGTLLRISGLRSNWSEEAIDELGHNLGRLVPPFKKVSDFSIWLTPTHGRRLPSRVSLPKVYSQPPYRISGTVDSVGVLTFSYRQETESGSRVRKGKKFLPTRSRVSSVSEFRRRRDWKKTSCGPFEFEFRVWDLDRDSLLELSRRFDLDKTTRALRDLISGSEFAGISLYRDDVLVLPKSKAARDWLGLDGRRISRVGTRLSANQVIGHVSIGASDNPELRDTSDRERLVRNPASGELQDFVFQVVAVIEDERDKDRTTEREEPLAHIFEELGTETLVANVTRAVDQNKSPKHVLQIVSKAAERFDRSVRKVQKRFIYYSRLASLGTIAAALQHEVGNQTVPLEDFVFRTSKAIDRLPKEEAARLRRPLELAEASVNALKSLARRFSALATRTRTGRDEKCHVEEIAADCKEILKRDLTQTRIDVQIPESQTNVEIDSGELGAILVNLLTNAIYWLSKHQTAKKVIQLEIRRKGARATVRVHDNGPGVSGGDEERIFWPGVTKKPGGLGMGLTVASELVAQKGGRMHLEHPGKLGGATFGFDLPLAK